MVRRTWPGTENPEARTHRRHPDCEKISWQRNWIQLVGWLGLATVWARVEMEQLDTASWTRKML